MVTYGGTEMLSTNVSNKTRRLLLMKNSDSIAYKNGQFRVDKEHKECV